MSRGTGVVEAVQRSIGLEMDLHSESLATERLDGDLFDELIARLTERGPESPAPAPPVQPVGMSEIAKPVDTQPTTKVSEPDSDDVQPEQTPPQASKNFFTRGRIDVERRQQAETTERIEKPEATSPTPPRNGRRIEDEATRPPVAHDADEAERVAKAPIKAGDPFPLGEAARAAYDRLINGIGQAARNNRFRGWLRNRSVDLRTYFDVLCEAARDFLVSRLRQTGQRVTDDFVNNVVSPTGARIVEEVIGPEGMLTEAKRVELQRRLDNEVATLRQQLLALPAPESSAEQAEEKEQAETSVQSVVTEPERAPATTDVGPVTGTATVDGYGIRRRTATRPEFEQLSAASRLAFLDSLLGSVWTTDETKRPVWRITSRAVSNVRDQIERWNEVNQSTVLCCLTREYLYERFWQEGFQWGPTDEEFKHDVRALARNVVATILAAGPWNQKLADGLTERKLQEAFAALERGERFSVDVAMVVEEPVIAGESVKSTAPDEPTTKSVEPAKPAEVKKNGNGNGAMMTEGFQQATRFTLDALQSAQVCKSEERGVMAIHLVQELGDPRGWNLEDPNLRTRLIKTLQTTPAKVGALVNVVKASQESAKPKAEPAKQTTSPAVVDETTVGNQPWWKNQLAGKVKKSELDKAAQECADVLKDPTGQDRATVEEMLTEILGAASKARDIVKQLDGLVDGTQ